MCEKRREILWVRSRLCRMLGSKMMPSSRQHPNDVQIWDNSRNLCQVRRSSEVKLLVKVQWIIDVGPQESSWANSTRPSDQIHWTNVLYSDMFRANFREISDHVWTDFRPSRYVFKKKLKAKQKAKSSRFLRPFDHIKIASDLYLWKFWLL